MMKEYLSNSFKNMIKARRIGINSFHDLSQTTIMSGTMKKSSALAVIVVLLIVAVGAGSYNILIPPAPVTKTQIQTQTRTVTQTGAVTQTVTQPVTQTLTQTQTQTVTTTVTQQPTLKNLLGISPPPPTPPPANKRDGVLILGYPAPPNTLDSWHTGFSHNYLMFGIYDVLILMAPDGKMYPSLATSVVSPDPKTFIITLRKGVKFHDGTELTAKDVKAAYDRGIKDKALFRAYAVASLWTPTFREDAVQIIDDYTVKMNLAVADADFLYDLGSHTSIHSKANLEKYGHEGIKTAPPMGSGAFKFVEYQPGTQMVLDRYDGYWAGPANVKRVIIRYIKEEVVRTLEIQKGGVHGFNVADNRFVNDLKKAGVQLFTVPTGLCTRSLYLALELPIFQDVNVRKALNHAINKQAFIDVLEAGYGKIKYGPMPAYMTDYYDPAKIPQYDYNPTKAKEFIAKSGYPIGFTVKLLVSNEQQELTAPIIVSNLGAIGIKVEVERDDAAGAQFRSFNWTVQMQLGGWCGSTPSPGGILGIWLHTKHSFKGGQNQLHTSGVPEGKLIDKQIEAFMAELDLDKRRPYVQEVDRIVMESALYVPLIDRQIFVAASHQVKGFKPVPSEGVGNNGLADYIHSPQIGLSTWIDTDEPILKPPK